MIDPWIVLGDFNTILSVNDRQNGVPVHPAEVKDFQECIEDIVLGQLKRTVYHNPGCSDHTPIIVSTRRVKQVLPRPFKLLNVLLQEQTFKEVIPSTCQHKVPGYTMYGVCKKPKLIKLNTKHLHKEVTSIEKRVEAIREKLHVTQQLLKSDLYNSNLIQEERELILELEKWSNIHEDILRQKSRVVRLAKGDLNTRYFHAQLKTRQARNHISSICNDRGIMLTDPAQVQQKFIKFFQKLLGIMASEMPCLNSTIAKDR
ncbi:uncharacterized protein LOC142176274 [Nicotiana tabacum]|uniref:Uncharacterized protein LOC142176274 n=1 Tax=Nicotiana tabacum TaxID=4097 RepID=A0AC58TQL7_TOBAC